MQNNLLTWAVIFLGGVIVLNVIIIFQLRKLKRDVNNQNFPDERYWELKLRIQVLITTITIVGSAIIFLGWNIKSQITAELKTEVLEDTRKEINDTKDSAKSLNNDLISLKEKMDSVKNSYSKVRDSYLSLNRNFHNLNYEVQTRISDIKTLLKIFVVPGIKISPDDKKIKLYFKDMRPVNSEVLPIFNKPPTVLIVGNNQAGVVIDDLSNDYIELYISSTSSYGKPEPKYYTISLWFIESDDQ